ncbi:Mus7/MMS22 family-domain-containing protein [Mariannaea sp. PMI_226]|nr:Mus7/MMS22 family-domain-containing protein [Mariannaea sp. PMI_226]
MVNWKELGEVPDSEDEDGFDSQELSIPLSTLVPVTTLKSNDDTCTRNTPTKEKETEEDIWDIPDSQELIHSIVSKPIPTQQSIIDPGPDARPIEVLSLDTSPLSSLKSSPLSSALSDINLPSVDLLDDPELRPTEFDSQIPHRSQDQLVGEDEISTSYVQLSLPPSNLTETAIHPRTSFLRNETNPILIQSQELGHDDEHLAARQAAVRYERSLRPRKPIQEHPYLLENAQYSSLLRQNGVRPLRMAMEAERRRRQQASSQEQDGDFEDDSQESRLPAISEDSQPNGLEDLSTSMDRLLVPSPSPIKTSPLNDRAGPSSQASSTGDTDGTSLLEEDLPTLEDLMRQNPRPHPKKAPKRKSSPPPSTVRKRKRYNVVDSDPLEPAAVLRLGAQPIDSPTTARSLRRSPEHDERAVEGALTSRSQSLSSTPTPKARPWNIISTPSVPLSRTVDSDSEDELARDPAPELDGVDSVSESEPESGSELVHTVGRRIKGVLPASWLRLDQQAARLKTPKEKEACRRHLGRSPERESRRGVAQPRQGSSHTPSTLQFLFDDSDDEVPTPRPQTTDEVFHVQTRLVEADQTPFSPANAPEDHWSDDSMTVIEDNWIDPMLPGRKRQLKLSETHRKTTKRYKTIQKASKNVSSKPPGQPRITSMIGEALARASSTKSGMKVRHRQSASSNRISKSGKRHQLQQSSRRSVPPKLSILDVIEPNAPDFLRIAARSARHRQDMGRSNPSRKLIQLATREDHLEAVSVLNSWRAGSIPQRPSVTEAKKRKSAQTRPPRQRLNDASHDNTTAQRRQPPSSSLMHRRLVRQVTHGGTVRYQSDHLSQPTINQRPRLNNQLTRSGSGVARPAQLEMDEAEQTRSSRFSATKRRLDRLFRKQYDGVSNTSTLTFHENGSDVGRLTSPPPEETPIPLRIAKSNELEKRKSRYRKKNKPKEVDIEAPQYSRANDPIPVEPSPAPEPIHPVAQGDRLLGLGPYGTQYTHHFEAFPLDSRVYFHESTLIGSGVLELVTGPAYYEKLFDVRPRSAYTLGDQTLRWGPWDAQVSSELGVVLDFIADQIAGPSLEDNSSHVVSTQSVAAFVMKFTMDSLSLPDPSSAKSFVCRILEVFRGFNGRLKVILDGGSADLGPRGGLIASINEYLLVSAFLTLSICRHDDALMGEQFQVEDLLKDMAKTTISSLLVAGLSHVRDTYQRLQDARFRDRGLTANSAVLHSWVLVRRILEHARIPRSSFWDILYTVIGTPEAVNSVDANEHEKLWRIMFTLLPLTEFNDKGILIAGSRHDTTVDGWALPQKLMKNVFQLYQKNVHQPPSFNSYCRALVGRCHYLVQQWGWRRCVAVVGVIFDFFGSQNLAHLRNEEVFRSPQFLEELGGKPSLAVEKGDRCFHIFLKLIAMSIGKLKETESLKDIRNLIARTMPNHDRQHLKEQTIHERDLAALRNHHDLLCTLFWASPPDLRPGAHMIERLVVPASSHKEACLINLRSWSQLARFIIASGEATTSFKPFAQWRNGFFQSIMHQFDSVASDMQQQFMALSKDASNKISSEMVDAMVAANRAAVMDVIHFSITASLNVMRLAPDLEAATFALNTLQLQEVFKRFTAYPPILDWSILQASLATLDVFMSHVDEFKDNEESQQSESQILNSAQADDAILVLDHDLSSSFFSMARAILSTRAERELSAAAAVDKFRCTEMVVTLSARLAVRFMNGGLLRLVDMFKFGKYGLFDDVPAKIELDQRKHLALFITTLLKHGYDDFNDGCFTLTEVWMLSIVKPRKYLAYENQLAQELLRHGKEFVPDAASGLAINPCYNSNRDMFEFAISWMRRSSRDAGPALKKIILPELTKTLKATMQQIKRDLRAVCQDAMEHPDYVIFIRDIISLIRAHGSDLCTVDDFFYQISKEYSPSVQDPQLQVAGMLSYGLRLSEGDKKVAPRLFFFLFNNFKTSLINDKLHEALKMLHGGMKNPAVFTFILSKMFPAIIHASFRDSGAFPLLEVYVQALRILLTRNVIPHELTQGDLPSLSVILEAVVKALHRLQERNESWPQERFDVLRQTLSMMNLLWPSFRILSSCEPTPQAWKDICRALECVKDGIRSAGDYIGRTLERRIQDDDRLMLPSLVRQAPADLANTDSDVNTFADNIVKDVRSNWVFSEDKVTIQAPGATRGISSTQSGKGVDRPTWTPQSLMEELYKEVKDWNAWYARVLEVAPVSSQNCISFLF